MRFDQETGLKRCSKCKQEKSVDDFHHDRQKPDGYCMCCKECRKGYRQERRGSHKEQMKAWRIANPERTMLVSARFRAKKEKLPFLLRQEDIVIPEACPICGRTMKSGVGRGRLLSTSPTLDKWDPKLGYVVGNIWVICHACNFRKLDRSGEELLTFALRIINAWSQHKEGRA